MFFQVVLHTKCPLGLPKLIQPLALKIHEIAKTKIILQFTNLNSNNSTFRILNWL